MIGRSAAGLLLMFLIVLTFCGAGCAESASESATLDTANIQKQIDTVLADNSISPENKFFYCLLAGREFYGLKKYELSQKYYELALDSLADQSKAEAYVNLISIDNLLKQPEQMKKRVAEAREYFSKHSNFADRRIDIYLRALEGGTAASAEEAFSYIGMYVVGKRLNELMQGKNYLEALLMYNPSALGDHLPYSTLVVYDLLNTLVNRKQLSNIRCEAAYRKEPYAYSYSIKICGAVVEYKETGSVSTETINSLEEFFKGKFRDYRYLLEAVKDLR